LQFGGIKVVDLPRSPRSVGALWHLQLCLHWQRNFWVNVVEQSYGAGHRGHSLHVWQNFISGDCHDEDWGEFYLSEVQLSWQASSSASLWPGPTRVRDQPPVAAQLSSAWSAKSGRAAGLPSPVRLYSSPVRSSVYILKLSQKFNFQSLTIKSGNIGHPNIEIV
jgi:hypothetical protein